MTTHNEYVSKLSPEKQNKIKTMAKKLIRDEKLTRLENELATCKANYEQLRQINDDERAHSQALEDWRETAKD